MSEFFLDFIFYTHDDITLRDDLVRTCRNAIADIMEHARFGAKTENDGRFGNTYAIPIDDIPHPETPHILKISYAFIYPLMHGDLSYLISEGLTELSEVGRRNHLIVSFQCTGQDL